MSKQLHRRGFRLIEFLIPEQRAVGGVLDMVMTVRKLLIL